MPQQTLENFQHKLCQKYHMEENPSICLYLPLLLRAVTRFLLSNIIETPTCTAVLRGLSMLPLQNSPFRGSHDYNILLWTEKWHEIIVNKHVFPTINFSSNLIIGKNTD